MKFSVLVLTFNPDFNKLFLTLQSIIDQDFDDFEIIIADDASKENPFEKIEAYFQKNKFTNYQFVANEKNQGTVKNILSGLEVAEGKYVKPISAGDLLYDEHVLSKVFQHMEQKKSECCFGLIQGYRMKQDKEVEKIGYYHPFDIEAYRKENASDRIVKNLVLYSDNVCGAGICYEKKYFIEYMNKIQEQVVYEEDIFQVLAAVEGRAVGLYDDYMIWYEIGEGVSTKKHTKFEELLRQDVERFYLMLYERHDWNKHVRKRKQLMVFYKIKNLYLRTILRTTRNLDAIRYLLISWLQRKRGAHRPVNAQSGFLEKPEFMQKLEKV